MLAAQAPDGDGVLAFAGVQAWRSALSSSVGLACAALLVAASPGRAFRRHGSGLLLGLVAGGILQSLLLGWRFPLPAGQTALALLAALLFGTTLALLAMRRRDEPEDTVRGVGWIGLLVASTGASLCIHGLGRITLRLGLGSPEEADWLAAVVLIGAATGGLAFGRFLAGFERDRARGATAALAMAGVGLGAWLSGRAALLAISPRGLRTLVRRFGLDLSDSGTLPFNGLLGLTLLLVPAFYLGTALYAARGRRTLATIALGAAAGPPIANRIMEAQGVANLLQGDLGSVVLIHAGAWIGAAAALWLLLPGSGLRVGGRIWSLGTALALLASLNLAGLTSIPVLRAWSRFPVDPIAVLEIPEGQMIIEPDSAGGMRANLNQRPIIGGVKNTASESMQIQLAMAQLDPQVIARGARVLLIGQLDPWRGKFLVEHGASRIDRSACWWRGMDIAEKYLGVDRRIPGEILSPAAARAAWDEGQFDLVLALARPGAAAHPSIPPDKRATPVVLWMDGAAPVAAQSWPADVLVGASGLQDFAIATTNLSLDDSPDALRSGPSPASVRPWRTLTRREWERPNPNRSLILERLAVANREAAPWLNSLAALCQAQHLPSPFETYAQSLTLDADLIVEMCDAAAELGHHPFVRNVMFGLADVLVQRRAIGLLHRALPPLSQAWDHPPEIEIARAQGHLEALEPELVPALLEPFISATAIRPKACAILAEAHYQAGEYAKAAQLFLRLQTVAPLGAIETKRLALSLLRSGSPLGIKQVEELLELDPEDEELRAALESGPGPPPDPSFSPETSLHDH